MAQHYALGGSGGAGGIDDGGEVVGLDGAGEGFGLGVEGAGAFCHELSHEHAGCGQIAGDLDVIHDHDSPHCGLRENGLDFAELKFCRNESHAGAGVAQRIGGLFGG